MKAFARRHGRTFAKYALVGVSGTLIDLGVFAGLIAWTPLGVTWIGTMIAATISFVFAVVNNYTWNRHWTFRATKTSVRRQFPRFVLISLGGWGLNTFFLTIFSLLFALLWPIGIVSRNVVAKCCASGVVLLYNFFANKMWTFR